MSQIIRFFSLCSLEFDVISFCFVFYSFWPMFFFRFCLVFSTVSGILLHLIVIPYRVLVIVFHLIWSDRVPFTRPECRFFFYANQIKWKNFCSSVEVTKKINKCQNKQIMQMIRAKSTHDPVVLTFDVCQINLRKLWGDDSS